MFTRATSSWHICCLCDRFHFIHQTAILRCNYYAFMLLEISCPCPKDILINSIIPFHVCWIVSCIFCALYILLGRSWVSIVVFKENQFHIGCCLNLSTMINFGYTKSREYCVATTNCGTSWMYNSFTVMQGPLENILLQIIGLLLGILLWEQGWCLFSAGRSLQQIVSHQLYNAFLAAYMVKKYLSFNLLNISLN